MGKSKSSIGLRLKDSAKDRHGKSLSKTRCIDHERSEQPENKMSNSLYQPLDQNRKEIRLLRVKAGSGTQRLQCELRQRFLDLKRKPRYETISYCWGDPRPSAQIWLSGTRKSIPACAEIVLRRMRLPDADRVLWIDAVCINQDDPEERGHQVGIMYEIYSNTQKNLVWLGEDDGTTAEALNQMKEILCNARMETDNFKNFDLRIIGGNGFRQDSIRDTPPVRSDPAALFTLLSRPWFQRLWVGLTSYYIPILRAYPFRSGCARGSTLPYEPMSLWCIRVHSRRSVHGGRLAVP